MIFNKKLFSSFIIIILAFSCQQEERSNFTLKAHINGLKKGVIYLQKKQDSTFVNLDSVVINNDREIKLETNIKEPIMLYLKMDKSDFKDHKLSFFADKGETIINTDIEKFSYASNINGSEHQKLYASHLEMTKRFQNENLELIKKVFEARKLNDTIEIKRILIKKDKLLKQRYAYSINFALMNNQSEVAPYITLNEISDTSIKYLDSIYGNFSDKIKVSYYGKQLNEFIEHRKNKLP